jgi:hypothetical protein
VELLGLVFLLPQGLLKSLGQLGRQPCLQHA